MIVFIIIKKLKLVGRYLFYFVKFKICPLNYETPGARSSQQPMFNHRHYSFKDRQQVKEKNPFSGQNVLERLKSII